MSAPIRTSSTSRSSRPEPLDTRGEAAVKTEGAGLTFQVSENRNVQPPPVNNPTIPDELLVSLSSNICNRSTMGHTAHRRHCKGCGIRRPDAVWHHPLGRKKYKYFLEQPTSLTGAGRDISFLCDATLIQKKSMPLPPLTDRNNITDAQTLSISENLIPEEYHIVKNKGVESLKLYEDAFTVQLQDDEQKLRIFPSLKPSGRHEALQLMRTMDDMLEKAGIHQQREELTQLSQMKGLLELVQIEQNIFNIVFHELIRQVSVGCSERGQLLAKIRQCYKSLLERIPQLLMALHTEAVAQRALDRRLTEEIHIIKTSMQQLSMELSKIRDHDAFVTQQAERVHWKLADALEQTHTNSEVIQSYHEMYELQRGRLEAQLLEMTKERDCWSQLTFCLALKVISMKKLLLVSQLHVHEQSWFKTAEHCTIYLTSTDTEDLSVIMQLTGHWRDELTDFMSLMKNNERAQFEEISMIQQGITKWLAFCTAQNKSPEPNYENNSLEKIHADLKQWSNTLALQSEYYQGEKLFSCQQKLEELGDFQEKWLNMSLQLFKRHIRPDREPPGGMQIQRELKGVLSELLKQLDTQVSGESGVHGQITSLLGFMESWVSKLRQTAMLSISDWLNLEKALENWRSLAEDILKNFSNTLTEARKDKEVEKSNIFAQTEKVLVKVQEFTSSMSNLSDGDNQKLTEEISSVHMAQTRWMLNLLLLMVPDYSDDQDQELELELDYQYTTNMSLQTLEEDAKILDEKLNYFSRYMTSFCQMILEEHMLQSTHQSEGEIEMDECIKLQRECDDWVEVSKILLSGLKLDQAELSTSPADNTETLVNEDVNFSAEAPTDSEVTEVKDETEAEPIDQVELTVCETPVVKLIGFDGNITQRKLGESRVHLKGADELVVSPATDDAEKAFSDLTTTVLLQTELRDSELRVQTAEQRALKAEEALQAALEKIQDLELQLQSQQSLEPKSTEEKKKTPPSSPPPETPPAPTKKTSPEAKPTSSTKRTRKR